MLRFFWLLMLATDVLVPSSIETAWQGYRWPPAPPNRPPVASNDGPCATAPSHGTRPDPQLLDHRPHRPRQVDACRTASSRSPAPSTPGTCASSTSTRWTSSASGASRSRPRTSGSPWKGHVFHLIDTPGHVDFGYEVSRSLAACEGVVLVVDAAQGIEAQTLANCYLALENDLEIVAALNKIDLPAADPDRYAMEIENVLGIAAEDILRISAKTGEGVPELLDAVVERIPPPPGDADAPLQALIFDSQFDQYRGVVSSIRVDERPARRRLEAAVHAGRRAPRGDRDRRAPAGADAGRRARSRRGRLPHRRHQGRRRGPLRRDRHDGHPRRRPRRSRATATRSRWCSPACSRSTATTSRTCATRWRSSSSTTPRSPTRRRRPGALGFGFRCGFLGLLHMEIVKERLEREFDLALIATAPSVEYRVHRTDGTLDVVDNPADLPDPQQHRLHRGAVLQGRHHHADGRTRAR